MSKDKDHEASLSDATTFSGKLDDVAPQSLSDQATFAGGFKQRDTQSLGDQATFGGQASDIDDAFDSEMEVVDLEARYKVEGVLGKGGMGEVLLALDTRLERKVAIKRMLGNAARNKTAVNRFLTEAKSIAALNHPNIVQIYDYGRAKDGPFLIMEFVEGNSLLDRCRDGALPLEEAVEITCQLCDGLGKAHSAGIIHRDIKPANVLMTTDGVPKLTDFGLAKAEAADTGMTMAGAVLGTLDFMPPEQRRDAALTDGRSDLWSLAASLYQMVTGKSPKIIKFNDVPKALHDVLGKALEDAKEDRYQTASEMRDALRAALYETPENSSLLVEDFGEGICPSCQTQNDQQRKYCKKCAGPLRATCLKCDQEIPVWDQVCGNCGGKQRELVADARANIDAKRMEAENLSAQLQFDRSLTLIREILAINDERLLHQKPWAEGFARETEAERQRQVTNAQTQFEESKKHREAFDYPSAIHAIESIPEPMRLPEVHAFLTSLRSDQEESTELLRKIKSRINERSIEGLLPLVERAIELRGDREDLHKLRSQLTERENKPNRERDEAYLFAESLFSEGKAREAFQAVRLLPASRLNPQQSRFRKILEMTVSAEQELISLVKEAKADGVIDVSELTTLYPKAIEYLDLNPNHASILKMRDDLLSRLKELPSLVHAELPESVLTKLPESVLVKLPEAIRVSLEPVNSVGMKFRLLHSGTFLMGEGEETHPVTLTKSFYLGIYQVTQEQYERVMGENPSSFKGPQNPVDSVSWEDAVTFCKQLSALPEEWAAGRDYRLPTEAEWEYACRAGSTTDFCFGDDAHDLSDYGCFGNNSGHSVLDAEELRAIDDDNYFFRLENNGCQTHPVGQRRPNAWGLYDMHGNVWEWCQDTYGDYPTGLVVDPTGPLSGALQVNRGGSWNCAAESCRSASRNRFIPTLHSIDRGFRVALSFSGIPK